MKNFTKLAFASLLLFSCVAFSQYGIGTDNPNTSAILDITSTTSGVLIPRMNSAERDAIATPANSLLIWNNSNNTFEVYKNRCSCWVTITDGGNTPANNLVNTAPTVNSLNYSGTFNVGGSGTIVYSYEDAQNDLQGTTTIQWEIANDNAGSGKTNFSTGLTASFGVSDAGRYVRAIVTPRAATGILNGGNYFGAWVLISPSTVPYGSALSVSGTVAQGSLLTGNYTFNGGSGIENAAGSNYIWQSATSNLGTGIQTIALPLGQSSHSTTINPLSTEINKYIRFGVLAKDNASMQATNYVYSAWVGPVTLSAEAAPIATNVSYSPLPGTNVVLVGAYNYSDVNSDPEGTSLFRWHLADDASGTNQTVITGANASTFTVSSAQIGKYVGFSVTPVALTGTLTGTQSVYYGAAASVSAANFSITSVSQLSNNFYVNRLMDGITDAIQVTINVTSAGSVFFTTNSVNGYSFSGGGIFPIGTNTVVLLASGSQLAYNSGGDNFTITGLGISTLTTPFVVNNFKKGADFTTHFNGITAGSSINNTLATYTTGESFSSNNSCLTAPISTSVCVGSTLIVGSNSYTIANINGQCWMTQNLKELPNGVAINPTQWLTNNPSDTGYYGYYNLANVTGSAGWASTESAVGDGLLYQWSAAMGGSIIERAKGICPQGWHIPSDCEWMYLEHGQGMALSEQYISNGFRSTTTDSQGTPGNKLRSQGLLSNNASGFSGVLTGYRFNTNGSFSGKSATGQGCWWSSTTATSGIAYSRYLSSNNRGVSRKGDAKGYGFSVRCLKD